MRRLFPWLPLNITVAAALFLSAAVCFGSSTIPVTGHVGDASAGIPPGLSVKFELYNCGSNIPRIPGSFSIVKQNFTLTPDATGLITGTIYPNDLIDCGGVTGTTRYNVTVLLDNVPQTSTACYAVLSTAGNFNLDTATPCTSATPPPPPGGPYDATYNNLTLTGLLSGGSALFSQTVQAHKFLLDFTPPPCSGGQFMTGYNSDLTVNCGSPPAATITSFNARGGAVVPETGDYTCSMVTGSICSLPTTYYQMVKVSGVSQTQRSSLNLISGASASVSCVDNPGSNSTDCTIAVTGADSATVCGANGCYFTKSDGTKVEYGSVSVPSTGTAFNTATITFPVAFTAAPYMPAPGTVGLPSATQDTTTPVAAQWQSVSTTGAVAYMAKVIVASAGGGAFSQTITMNWFAIGK